MKTLYLVLLLAVNMPAADLIVAGRSRTPKRAWIRRATLAAGCAASLLVDTVSTQRATAAGAVERNPLFSDSQGRPQWGRIAGIKAGFCGVSAIMQETHVFRTWQGPRSDWTWTGINAGTTAVYTWAGIHNLGLLNSHK